MAYARNHFTTKGYGRIYVKDETQIDQVHELIKSIDAYEFTYMPKALVVGFSEYPNVVYMHKFDALDLDKLTALAWDKGIYIWCFDAGNQEHVTDVRVFDDSGNYLPGKDPDKQT